MLLAIEGFEGGGTTSTTLQTYLARRGFSRSVDVTKTTGRFDDVAVTLISDKFVNIPFAAKQTVVVGFAFKFSAFGADNQTIIELRDNTSAHIKLQLKTTGELRVISGITLLGTTGGLGLAPLTWYYIELKVTIDNSPNGFVEVRVDNSMKLQLSSQDTQYGGNATVDHAHFIGDDSKWFTFDDIYILDDTGGINDDFLGNNKVVTLKPDGDGDDTEFTPATGPDNYTEVDDGATVDDDTTYVEQSISTTKDLYDYEALGSGLSIKGVSVLTEAKETDAIDFTLHTVVKSDVTESDDTAQALSSSWTIIERIVDEDPHTSAAWDLADLNIAQFGVKIG